MPPEVGIGDVVFIDGESGLREGCGVAIFELTPEAITRLQVSGVRGLNMDGLTSPGATSGDASASSLWHETPYVETGDGLTMEDSWIVGLGCAQMSPHLVTTISRAMAQPGSFYFKRYESGVLVIPAAGIAAFVYNG